MRTFVLLLGLFALVGCTDKKGSSGTTTITIRPSGTTPASSYTGTFEVGPPPKEVK